MAGSETLTLQVVVPVWPSQDPVPAPTPVPGGMGAATRLSLQGGCVQAGDASEESSAPTYSDSRRSIPREPSGIMGKWTDVFFKSKADLSFTLEQRSSSGPSSAL